MSFQGVVVTEAMAEISKLSTGELKELCNSTSDEKYDEFVEKSQKVGTQN